MKNNKGITLIVLIITVIILIILTGLSINIAVGGNLFDRAKDAVHDTNDRVALEEQEVNEILDFYDEMEEHKNNKECIHNWERQTGSNRDTIKCVECDATYLIGQKISYNAGGNSSATVLASKSGTDSNQTLNRDNNIEWVLLGCENGKLLITTKTPTNVSFTMKGASIYNNAIDILDKVCEDLYGQGARSIRRDDVDKCFMYTPNVGMYMGFDNTWVSVPKNSKVTNVNEIVLFTKGTYTPDGVNTKARILEYPVDGVFYRVSSVNDTYITLLTDESDTSNTVTKTEIELIFGSSLNYRYYLATTGLYTENAVACWGSGRVYDGAASSSGLYYSSTNLSFPITSYVRPVIEIDG